MALKVVGLLLEFATFASVLRKVEGKCFHVFGRKSGKFFSRVCIDRDLDLIDRRGHEKRKMLDVFAVVKKEKDVWC